MILSLIIPVFNEKESLELFLPEIIEYCRKKMEYYYCKYRV